ncbi:substrate-binding domain-containing protein [Microbacterium sp. LRZ72]|uniref:substrate-binding domain-containing protein n=1 Tax=Microbacterium sp. LRZ72 TaxID=2942481 RepID=UPI0029B830F5|nr:substrate-binding domain-containing protein [Microbacterium sp. LRZ72]MDX2378090.1 substrate-binding domain-containing protein [Microbacterium sp. LRZ72]
MILREPSAIKRNETKMSIRHRDGTLISRRRRLFGVVAAAAATVLVLAGCSGGGEGSNGSSTDADEVDTSLDYDEAAVQEIVDTAFGVEMPLSELPEEAVEGFARASIELSPEQVQTALDCWKQPECTVGDGDVHIGVFNAVDNLWQTTAAMNVILQALTYPEVGTITYAFVDDLPSAQSAVRSMVSSGVDAIVSYNAFGAAMSPVFTEAQAAGTVVTTYVGETPEADGSVINNQVYAEACEGGTEMGGVLVDALGLSSNEEVAFFFGVPGNPQDTLVQSCLEEELANSDGPEIAFNQDTDWTRPGTSAAASALISSGIPAAAILNTYADPMPQVVNVYDQAGEDVPPILTWTEMNEFFGIWEERLGTDREFDLYYTNALVNQARLALTNAMTLIAGEEVPERTPLPLPLLEAVEGVYQPDLPGDFPGWSALVPEDVMNGMLD